MGESAAGRDLRDRRSALTHLSRRFSMDSITSAVLAALGGLSQTAVRDAYSALKSLIAQKFGRDSSISRAVDDLEAKPESAGRKAVLQEEVAAVGALADPDIVAAAKAVQEQVRVQPLVQVHASGERSVAIGGNVQGGTIVTGDQPPPPPSGPSGS